MMWHVAVAVAVAVASSSSSRGGGCVVSGRFNNKRDHVLLSSSWSLLAHTLSNLLPQSACVHPHLIKSNNEDDNNDDEINTSTQVRQKFTYTREYNDQDDSTILRTCWNADQQQRTELPRAR